MSAIERDIIVACLNSKEQLKRFVEDKSRLFENDSYRWMFDQIVEHFTATGKRIKKDYLVDILNQASVYTKFRDGKLKKFKFSPETKKIFQLNLEKTLIIDEVPDITDELVVKVRKKSMLVDAVLDMSEKLQNEEIDEAYAVLRGLQQDDSALHKDYKRHEWTTQFGERQEERRLRRLHPERYKVLPLPWPAINKALGADTGVGGIQGGELASFSGTTGRGKSVALAYSAVTGATVEAYNGAYFSVENTAWQSLQRMDSAYLNIEYEIIKGYGCNPQQLIKFQDKFSDVKGQLWVFDTDPRTTTVLTIEKALQELEWEEKKIDFIAVDYADLLLPVKYYKEYRLGQREVYWGLKALCLSRGIPGLTATQAKQEYAEKRAGSESLSEAYDKARLLDIIITLNQNIDQKTRNEMLMILAKNRDGVSGIQIPVITKFEKMRIEEVNYLP